VLSVSPKKIKVKLARPLCISSDQRVVISRKVNMRWRLSGYGQSI
ncbi:MAG: translation initiation factor IF-2 subunit gamma, partial [Candidatus Diapherotrites archaeon]|nr:translation initiation factor IF-2 subunit gamma [Candidatus Diapherotrites archaeon]